MNPQNARLWQESVKPDAAAPVLQFGRDPTRGPDPRITGPVLRRFAGPIASEVSVHLTGNPSRPGPVAAQVHSIYTQLHTALLSQKGSLDDVVQETVFFRNIGDDQQQFLAARRSVLERLTGVDSYHPASTCIQQPPLDDRAAIEVLVTAMIPHVADRIRGPERDDSPLVDPGDALSHRVVSLGHERHIFVANTLGTPGASFDESASMFRRADEFLKSCGTNFLSVVRTWIFLRHMERDYAGLNRARREFFDRADVRLRPASTGINGAPLSRPHNLCMGLYAIDSAEPPVVEGMTTPTLNEAWTYGSDFSRGMKVTDSNKIALYVSGTASIDEFGDTVHVGDFDAQVDRMLLNIETLLKNADASFDDVVRAVSYVKNPADARRYREILQDRGLLNLPHAVVEAHVCRPDLLCEMEVTALLPRV